MVFEELGNVSEGYAALQMKVIPTDRIYLMKHVPNKRRIDPYIVLKQYCTLNKNEYPDKKLLRKARDFLEKAVEAGCIERHTGLGFAIISSENANVSIWHETDPMLLVTSRYYFDKDYTKDDEKSLPRICALPREMMPFSSYELAIASHEAEAWKRFLNSRRKESDKERYLEDTIEKRL